MGKITSLVFEGGGVKGVGYLGAIQVLAEEHDKMKDVNHVAGASAGAIMAVLLGLGYTLKEIEPYLSMDFTEFTDKKGFFAKLDISDFGMNTGDNFDQWSGERIKEKLGKEEATFADLHAKILSQNHKTANFRFREIHMMGSNLSTRQGELFSYYTTPTMPIREALRISISFPFFFKAKRYIKNQNGEFCLDNHNELMQGKEGDVYVDGGVALNYPVEIFDNDGYPNPETLGFKVDTPSEINFARDGRPPKSEAVDNVLQYGGALVSTGMWSQQSPEKDNLRTVYINTGSVSTLAFKLDEKDKQFLIDEGKKATRRYFNMVYENLNPAQVGDRSLENNLRLQKRDRTSLLQKADRVYFKENQKMMQCIFTRKEDQSWYIAQDKAEKYYRWCSGFTGLTSLTLHKKPGGKKFVITLMMTDGLRQAMKKTLDKSTVNPMLAERPYSEAKDKLILLQARRDTLHPTWMDDKAVSPENRKGLWTAVSIGATQEVQKFIQGDVSLEGQDEKSNSLLHEAAFMGHAPVVKLLIEKKMPIEADNDYGDKPLHKACNKAAYANDTNAETVKILLEAGASPNVHTKDNKTPVMVAAEDGHVEALNLLIEYGADLNAQKDGGLTALMLAAKAGRQQAVEVLLKNSARACDIFDENGFLALDYAKECAQRTGLVAIQNLIENYDEPNNNNNNNNIDAGARKFKVA